MPRFIHADNCALYAQDANECEEPWLRWQYKHPLSVEWMDAISPLPFDPGYGYRRKPRTILINGFEVPEPVREPLEPGQAYWIADTSVYDSPLLKTVWYGDCFDRRWLAAGLIHLSREAARQHIYALLSFTKRGG